MVGREHVWWGRDKPVKDVEPRCRHRSLTALSAQSDRNGIFTVFVCNKKTKYCTCVSVWGWARELSCRQSPSSSGGGGCISLRMKVFAHWHNMQRRTWYFKYTFICAQDVTSIRRNISQTWNQVYLHFLTKTLALWKVMRLWTFNKLAIERRKLNPDVVTVSESEMNDLKGKVGTVVQLLSALGLFSFLTKTCIH